MCWKRWHSDCASHKLNFFSIAGRAAATFQAWAERSCRHDNALDKIRSRVELHLFGWETYHPFLLDLLICIPFWLYRVPLGLEVFILTFLFPVFNCICLGLQFYGFYCYGYLYFKRVRSLTCFSHLYRFPNKINIFVHFFANSFYGWYKLTIAWNVKGWSCQFR